MTEDPRKIDFDQLTITATPVSLVRCARCKSLMLEEDAQEHADWHGKLGRADSLSAMGFGFAGGSDVWASIAKERRCLSN